MFSFHQMQLHSLRSNFKEYHWQSRDILNIYSDIFTGIGKFPGGSLQIPNQSQMSSPLDMHLGTLLLIYQEAFHQKIQNLEWSRNLEPVKDVTEWVKSFVIMCKEGSSGFQQCSFSRTFTIKKTMRIFLDWRDLNEALEHEPYYTRSIKEILGKFHGMTCMTWYDPVYYCLLSTKATGWWNSIQNSRKLTTMALETMDVSSRQDFQWVPLLHRMCSSENLMLIFLSMPGVTGIADDMIIYGKIWSWTWWKSPKLFGSLTKENLTLNPDYMHFRLPKVYFFGHTWSDKGLSADPKNIKAVKTMELQDVEPWEVSLGWSTISTDSVCI